MDGCEEMGENLEEVVDEDKHDLRLYQSPYLQEDLAVIPEDLQEQQDTLMSELSERIKNRSSNLKSIATLQSEVVSPRSNLQNS